MKAPSYVISFEVSGRTADAARDHASALLEAVEEVIRSYRESCDLKERPRISPRCNVVVT